MRTPSELGECFCEVLSSRNVYFQPPESAKMKYPCVVYHFSRFEQRHADDISYLNHKCYMVKFIDKDPDSAIPEKILALPMCRFDRFYTADGLNHWVFILYF